MKFKIFSIKSFLFIVSGAGLGFSYYYFIGCTSGSCPIQSNPYISTLYGALVGFFSSFSGKKKIPENENK